LPVPSPIDHVHVATVRTDDPGVLSRLDDYRRLMDVSEHARHGRLVREADRVSFLITRGLVRTLLSRFVDVPASDWTFAANEYGRPEVANLPAGSPPLRFNLSHTTGLVACAVVVGREIGLDVENVDRPVTHDVAGRFFAPREVSDLRALPPDRQPAVFFDYWTLKEAYIKARGLGLVLPLHHFAFDLTCGGDPRITFDDAIDDDPASWQFRQVWATPSHRMAIGVRSNGRSLPVAIVPTVPLAE
jgi:4'-phosphopantetheinyl transferase